MSIYKIFRRKTSFYLSVLSVLNYKKFRCIYIQINFSRKSDVTPALPPACGGADMKNLLIFGMGQYGIVAKEVAEETGQFEKIAFLDDNNPDAAGKLSEGGKFIREYTQAFAAVGNPELRAALLKRAEDTGFAIATLVSPRAYVSRSAEIGKGCIVEPMAVVNAAVKLKAGVFVCAGSVVNHNAEVGAMCQIDCNATVAASAQVPEGTKVGSGEVYRGGETAGRRPEGGYTFEDGM